MIRNYHLSVCFVVTEGGEIFGLVSLLFCLHDFGSVLVVSGRSVCLRFN